MLRASARSLSLTFLLFALVHVGTGLSGTPLEVESLQPLVDDAGPLSSEAGVRDATATSTSEQISAAAWLRMRESIEADRYAMRAATVDDDVIYETHNPAHGLRATFRRDGVRVRSAGGGEAGWEWALQLERFGYEGALERIDNVAPVVEGNRVEYRYPTLTEWYVNEPGGLEQGFTLSAAPPPRKMAPAEQGAARASRATAPIESASAPDDPEAGRGTSPPLVLELAATGLETRQDVAGRSILLSASDGTGVLHYSGLIAWDAEGIGLSAEMWATGKGIRIEVDDRGAAYPLIIDPFIESAILRASDAQASDGFGISLAVSGDTAIVGAWSEDGGQGDPRVDAGAAYIFERDRGGTDNWGEVKKLIASDAQGGDRFGYSVAISGAEAIVGARFEDGGQGDPIPNAGAAYVYERDHLGTDNWGEVKKLAASDAEAGDDFGWSVAISGDRAIVGPYKEDGGPGDPIPSAGAAYIFERNQGGVANWGQVKKLTASDAEAQDHFGFSVAISGSTAVVGAYLEDSAVVGPDPDPGAAYIFERDHGGTGNWGEVKKLTASDAQENDYFGDPVAISGDIAIVAAVSEDGGPGDPISRAGAAYVFERNQGGAGNWGQAMKLTAPAPGYLDSFGSSVAVSGDTAIVAAVGEDVVPGDPSAGVGVAHIFDRNRGGTSNWGPVKRLTGSGDSFARSVAISGGTVISGGSADPNPGVEVAFVFDRTAWDAWVYVLDGYGGLHAAGPGAVPISPAPPYFGFDVARDVELSTDGAYVLDGFGGVHVAGSGVSPFSPAPPYFGFDIARDLELAAGGGAYVLDGWGGVHAVGGAPSMMPATPYFGFDIARDLELGGGGYYVLDGFGAVHAGAGATQLNWVMYFGFDILRDLELAAGGGGYAMDGFGGIHAMAGAPFLLPATPFFGVDVARDLELEPGPGGHFVLDGFGGMHTGSGATALLPAPPYFGFDIARDLELR